MKPLFLASRSPRRRELLSGAGIPFQVVDVDVDETSMPDLAPEALVRELARLKAQAGSERCGSGRVLGADTLVASGADVLGKPAGDDDGRRMLERLSGTTHRVLTGICLLDVESGREWLDHDTTLVTMRRLSTAEIDAYVASGEGRDKAGGYAIQETADQFVERIEGSWSNVVGLPLERLLALLERTGTWP